MRVFLWLILYINFFVSMVLAMSGGGGTPDVSWEGTVGLLILIPACLLVSITGTAVALYDFAQPHAPKWAACLMLVLSLPLPVAWILGWGPWAASG